MRLIGSEYPADATRRQELLEGLDRVDALRRLDHEFVELEASTDADALLTAYLVEASDRSDP
jgi:hypothetical protein